MTTDQRGYVYRWDHENRLIEVLGPPVVESATTQPEPDSTPGSTTQPEDPYTDPDEVSTPTTQPTTQPSYAWRQTYTYDAMGRRVSRTTYQNEVASTTYYVSAGMQEVAEYTDGSDAAAPSRTYVYGSYVDEPVQVRVFASATTQPASTQSATTQPSYTDYYYHTNALYSVIAVTDTAGTVVERYTYDAYGQRTITDADGTPRAESRLGNEIGFTGRRLDPLTNQYYFRARYYDAAQGRFISRDPLEYVDGMSLYGGYYVPNGLDPTGTDRIEANYNEAEQVFDVYYIDEWSVCGGAFTLWLGPLIGGDAAPVLVGKLDIKSGFVKLANGRYTTMQQIRKESDEGGTNWDKFITSGRTFEKGLGTGGQLGKLQDMAAAMLHNDSKNATFSPDTVDNVINGTELAVGLVKDLLWFYATAPLTLAEGVSAPAIRGLGYSSSVKYGKGASGVNPAAVVIDESAVQVASGSGVWAKSSVLRGRVIEDALTKSEYSGWFRIGADAKGKFPLVDFQKGNNLVSLKTVDTSGGTWIGRMQEHIVDLGTRGATVDGKAANMILDLRVQPGGLNAAKPLVDFGAKSNVSVIIKEFP
jgi:filamentous hemagglutinin